MTGLDILGALVGALIVALNLLVIRGIGKLHARMDRAEERADSYATREGMQKEFERWRHHLRGEIQRVVAELESEHQELEKRVRFLEQRRPS